MADLLSVLSLIPWSSTFQDGGWVKFRTLGTLRMSHSLPTFASVSLIQFSGFPVPSPPILGQTVDRCIRQRLEHERAVGETRDVGQVFLPKFSSRFLSALQQTEQKGFFICFMIKKPLNSSRITFY